MRARICAVVVGVLAIAAPSTAFACGGLIGPNGAVNLQRTTTLAAHHNGVEHYITAFSYAGGGGKFGSIVPLPAMPSEIVKGGDWTLQRLIRETSPAQPTALSAGATSSKADSATVVYETTVDALDIKVLRGGGRSVGEWASDHGFRLPPDAPEVLDFYAKRSPYFLTAVFDADAARKRGQQVGDGTPVHIAIPLRSPWVPLRILALGKLADERVDADVYLLTDRIPNLMPSPSLTGYTVERQVPASSDLLADLRSDRGMEWLPASGMTLTHLVVSAPAPKIRYDLAINDAGGLPSRTRAGLPPLPTPAPTPKPTPVPTLAPSPTPQPTLLATPVSRSVNNLAWIALSIALIALLAAAVWMRQRTTQRG